MAKKEIEKKEDRAVPKPILKSYILRDDFSTDKGVKKKGSKIELSEGGAKILKSKNLI